MSTVYEITPLGVNIPNISSCEPKAQVNKEVGCSLHPPELRVTAGNYTGMHREGGVPHHKGHQFGSVVKCADMFRSRTDMDHISARPM